MLYLCYKLIKRLAKPIYLENVKDTQRKDETNA